MRGMVEHPRSVATAYRKGGEQLSREEKKALGVRANAFMSRQAADELTDAGKARALTAHETTLLRAGFTENRFNRLHAHDASPDSIMRYFDGFQYQTNATDCPFCKSVDGTVVQQEDAAILPSPECVCETANYSINRKIDWLKGIE